MKCMKDYNLMMIPKIVMTSHKNSSGLSSMNLNAYNYFEYVTWNLPSTT